MISVQNMQDSVPIGSIFFITIIKKKIYSISQHSSKYQTGYFKSKFCNLIDRDWPFDAMSHNAFIKKTFGKTHAQTINK